MKRIILLMCLINTAIFAQFDITAGGGIGFYNHSDLTDYIETITTEDDANTFGTGGELFLAGDYVIGENHQIGVEYTYSYYSFNGVTNSGGMNYDLSYSHHKPSVMYYYVVPNTSKEYRFKFGAGFGPRYISVDEDILSAINYTSTGWGVLLRAQGVSALDKHVFITLGGTCRYDQPGVPENNGKKITYANSGSKNHSVDFDGVSFSVEIGITYSF